MLVPPTLDRAGSVQFAAWAGRMEGGNQLMCSVRVKKQVLLSTRRQGMYSDSFLFSLLRGTRLKLLSNFHINGRLRGSSAASSLMPALPCLSCLGNYLLLTC